MKKMVTHWIVHNFDGYSICKTRREAEALIPQREEWDQRITKMTEPNPEYVRVLADAKEDERIFARLLIDNKDPNMKAGLRMAYDVGRAKVDELENL